MSMRLARISHYLRKRLLRALLSTENRAIQASFVQLALSQRAISA
jgi:hypothetical protein